MKQQATSQESGADVGRQMHAFLAELFPICRSITGPGVRATMAAIAAHVPLQVREVPTGTQVFDWRVPREWEIRDAYIADQAGRRIVDFRRSNLHVVNYSVPVRATMTWGELKGHLFTLPEHPAWIPYRTAYYDENWGFCLSHEQFLQLDRPAGQQRRYEVCIDATLADGSMTYGELLLPGKTDDEVLISCHTCHPSLANDNLSGIAVATWLAKELAGRARRYSYRFLYMPGTIGPIAWLAENESRAERIKHGLVLAVLGDSGPSTYKRSRRGDAEIDRAVAHVLEHSGDEYRVLDFAPTGYHERQFCSPGFNLPVGCLMRTPHGEYPEYHTSADNLDLVRPESLADSLTKCRAAIKILEHNRRFENLNPKCEPQLGRRGLYRAVSGGQNADAAAEALLWVLNFSDGRHNLLDIAERSGLEFSTVERSAHALVEHDLLRPVDPLAFEADIKSHHREGRS